MSKFKEYVENPYKFLFAIICNRFHFLSDVTYSKIMYRAKTGKKLDLKDPKTLNEKLQWIKINYKNPILTKYVDKIGFKEIVSDTLGQEYVVKTLAVWESADDIDFSKLPSRFVLKCTHDSHSIIICNDKERLDIKKVKKFYKKRLKYNQFWYGREWAYKNVVPKIIAEEYLESSVEKCPIIDYKFYCYGGKPQYFMYSLGEASHDVKNHKFDLCGNSIDYLFKKKEAIHVKDIELPSNLNTMISLVEKMCSPFQHVRLDLYNVDGKIYFGEATFYSSAGIIKIDNEDYSNKLAGLIDLEKCK